MTCHPLIPSKLKHKSNKTKQPKTKNQNQNATNIKSSTKTVPGAILRRDKGGGQSQMQGGQEILGSPSLMVFLNLQYKAGPHTANADATANTTKQDLKQAPDRRDIFLLFCVSGCVFVGASKLDPHLVM